MKFACIGECMIELSHPEGNSATISYGGDSLNTAIYLARMNDVSRFSKIDVEYITALGDDPYSESMIKAWKEEGVLTNLVDIIPGKLPGLYAIKTDDKGERSFYYWRSASAAREMMKGSGGSRICHALKSFDMIYLSGITLSILDEASLARLTEGVLLAAESGVKVAFDTNYRPRGWPLGAGSARTAMDAILKCTTIALPSLEDERILRGNMTMTAEECARRMGGLGAKEVCVKDAQGHVVVYAEGSCTEYELEVVVVPVDTTGAGDSFNAAYLAARSSNMSIRESVEAGNRLAAHVVQHRGAVIPRHLTPVQQIDEIFNIKPTQ